MCDYCDCRSQPEIAELSEEHIRLLALTAKVRRAVVEDVEQVSELLDEIATLLDGHTAREERGVFHALRQEHVPEEYVELFEHDHARIDELLTEIRLRGGDVLELIRLVEDHVHREETDMYPAAHQLLTPADWDALAGTAGRAVTH